MWIENRGNDGVPDDIRTLIDDAKYITDPTEFAKALHEAEDYLVQEQFLEFPLFQFSSPALVSSSLSGYELHSTMPYFSACVKD